MSNPFASSAPVANQSVEMSLIKILQILFGASTAGALNIKMVGGSATVPWGGITGTLANQGDLVAYIAAQIAANPTAWGHVSGTLTAQTDLTLYIANQISAALTSVILNKGGIACAANPNYPEAAVNDLYFVTTAGKIGGASGTAVEIGDTMICINTNVGGTQAAVGADWIILQTNIPGLTTVGLALATLTSPSAITFLRVNADNSVTALSASDFRTALGNTTVGNALDTLANPSAISFIRLNADNTATALSAADFRTALGNTTVGNALDTLANPSAISFIRLNADNTVTALSASDFRTALGNTTVGNSLDTLANPGAITFLRVNADNTVTALSAAAFQTALGNTTVGSNLDALADPSAITFLRINANNTVSALSGAAFLSALPIVIQGACSDETTALTTGTKLTYRLVGAKTFTGVRGSLTTAQASGSLLTVDIQKNGVTILSTLLTFTNTSRTTVGAVTPAVISVTSGADDDEMTVIVTQVGAATVAAGLKVVLF